MLKRVVILLLACLVLGGASVGCGANPQKGAKKDKDMPKPAEP